VHGRDQDPEHMLEHLVGRLAVDDVAYVLPRAAGGTWYPGRFTDPPPAHAPWYAWALDAYDAAIDLVLAAGVPVGRLVVAGFSQGGCLTAELLARRPRPFGAAAILTGSLFGPAGSVAAPRAPLGGLPVLLTGSRFDDWVPLARVEHTAGVLAAAGAAVDLRPHDDREHHLNAADVSGVRELLLAVRDAP
jgi:phospholipase/carboxylesterase